MRGTCWGSHRFCIATAIIALFAMIAPSFAQAAASVGNEWVTLGTQGGPMSSSGRSQPANALIVGNDAYLIDVGDGAIQQLAKAGVAVPAVKAVFISHLHFDHTGGLAALLGLRLQLQVKGKLTVFGPPGTSELVTGLVGSMRPASAAGYGLPGQQFADPSVTVEVVELTDGQSASVGPMIVRVRQNTHYSFPPDSDLDRRYKSLSFRFDLNGRSIVYTGDTGPSIAVEELAAGADLLVSEMIDEEATLAAVRRNLPSADPAQIHDIVEHLTSHHLKPADVGRLAKRAGVKAVVITHLAGDSPTSRDVLRYLAQITAIFPGTVIVANDLERF